MAEDHILAIDCGTQSVRGLLWDLHGTLVARSRIAIEPYVAVQPGWAEQRPEYFWEVLCQACQQLWHMTEIPPSAVRGVALTTQRGTVINVDHNGQPLRPAIIWLDQRQAKGVAPVRGRWGLLFKLGRVEERVAQFQADAEANWIRLNQPEIWQQTYKFLLLSGYLSYRLTGRFVDSIGSQVGYIPYDARRQGWAGRGNWRWQAAPMDRSLLPDLVPPAQPLGVLTAEAARGTGLPVGLPVIAAAADKACEVLGVGCLSQQIGCLSYGTAATFNTLQPKYLEVVPPVPPYPAATPGGYHPEIAVNRGYWMVSWFKQQFAHYEQQIAEERGIEPEELFDELVNQVPPGALGLMLQPYWSPSGNAPGPEAKGAIIGFGGVHTRAHVYRAILEGLAYSLREGKEQTERRSGVTITELRVSGGGSRSDAALQLTADVFGLPTARAHTYETSGLGAAIDAAVGLKLYPDFPSAVRAMTRVERVFTPDPAAHAIYDRLYRQVYLGMYRKLRPLYQEIQKITGYPAAIG
ncbi:MAG: carbohydrate kinase [Herpetosiphonaceae bacterium]|nr:carbohydrate kinase [Herpetosiphonaceae bacterium]